MGPNILYSKSDISNIYQFPDLSRILDFSENDGTFLFSFRKFQTVNTIFNMESKIARGGKDLIMISCVIRASYFKNELTDIFQYLQSKTPILENFAKKLKELPNFNLILHKYKKNPNMEQLIKYCEEDNVDFFSVYDYFFELIFPEAEVKIITQDINLKKKILLLGSKDSGKDTFLKTIETLQFYSQRNLDIPTRILGIIIDNIIVPKPSELQKPKLNLIKAQAIIYIIRNINERTLNELDLLLEDYLTFYLNEEHDKIPFLIINNFFKGEKPLKLKEIKEKSFNFIKLKKEKIPVKYYSFNVFNENPRLLEPLKWLIKQIFT
ncbi:MAG: hypothetical protein ACFFAT_10645 [Promethearchaeota archaeon]